MKQRDLTPRQLGVWLLAAASAPLSSAAGAGWAAVALAGLAMLPLTRLSGAGWRQLGRTVSVVEGIWLSLLAGMLLRQSGVFWPGSRSEWFVPLVLITLAFLTRPESAPRVGAVVGLCLAALYVPVLIGGAAQAKPEWLRSYPGTWSWPLLVGMLLPALWGLWRKETAGMGHTLAGTAVIGLLFAVLVQGILSPVVAPKLPDAFYQTARTMELGILSRIEPVIAVASTLGWYALAVLFHASAVRVAAQGGLREKTARAGSTLVTAAGVLTGVRIPDGITAGVCIFLWIAIPLWTEKRNFKKDEKRC